MQNDPTPMPKSLGWGHQEQWRYMCAGTGNESLYVLRQDRQFIKYKSMIIQIKMDIKFNHEIIKYLRTLNPILFIAIFVCVFF